MKNFGKLAAVGACFSLMLTALLHADVVETKNGSRIAGKITLINPSAVTVATDFAGDVVIKRAEIVSVVTDAPVNVRLSDGKVIQGTISNAMLGDPAGSVMITESKTKETITTKLGDVSRTWALKAKDPEAVKLERHWNFEAGMDVTGKTGSSEQIGTSYSFRATLASSRDTLQLFTFYNRQKTDGVTAADQFRLGGDYQYNIQGGRTSWYGRDELGFDHVQLIKRNNTAAAGVGYDLVKAKAGALTVRSGLSYRYVDYDPNTDDTPDLRDFGLDAGIVNLWTFKKWSLSNRITYTPSFDDMQVYQIMHDSYIELPMTSPHWKFRIGVTNNYTNTPPPAVERLDTTYYARLLLNWKK